MKPARSHMPGNEDKMPHARTDAETRATCLGASRCIVRWDTVAQMLRSTTVTHVVNGSKFIHATPVLKFFTGLQSYNR